MRIKNLSFETIVAVAPDGKSTEVFQPTEERTVTDEMGKWYMDRYNTDKMYFAQIEEPVVEKSVTEPIVESSVPVVEQKVDYDCLVCGKSNKSNAGLSAHMRAAHAEPTKGLTKVETPEEK